MERIGFHGENVRFLEDSLQKNSPDDLENIWQLNQNQKQQVKCLK